MNNALLWKSKDSRMLFSSILFSSIRASTAEIKMSLFRSTQRFSSNTWNSLFSFHLSYEKRAVHRLQRVQKRAMKVIQGLGSWPYEERCRENCVCSALSKEDLEKTLSPVFKGWLERWRLTFYKESCGKDESNE